MCPLWQKQAQKAMFLLKALTFSLQPAGLCDLVSENACAGNASYS